MAKEFFTERIYRTVLTSLKSLALETPASKGFSKIGIGEIFGDHLLNFYHSRPFLLFRLVLSSEMCASRLTE